MAGGSTSARGYGHHHRRLRAQLAPLVATGTATCWRCRELIASSEPWDLGHDDEDRRIIRGPEHRGPCNRAAGAAKTNTARAQPLRTSQTW